MSHKNGYVSTLQHSPIDIVRFSEADCIQAASYRSLLELFVFSSTFRPQMRYK